MHTVATLKCYEFKLLIYSPSNLFYFSRLPKKKLFMESDGFNIHLSCPSQIH